MTTLTLHRLLQTSGFDSRRRIRQAIADGEFTVNDEVITNPTHPVDPERDVIRYQGRRLKLKVEPLVYFLLNKPVGVVSTLSDPARRRSITDLIGGIRERVYPAGRLDFNSEGLILLTNDGDFMKFIISPASLIPKEYLIKVRGNLTNEIREKLLTKGVHIEGSRIRPLKIEHVRSTQGGHCWLKVTITEGKKHIVRKLFRYSGHPVERLRRLSIGSFHLKGIPTGHWKEIPPSDVEAFRKRYAVSHPKKPRRVR